jgi:hypothetical protein
MPATSTLSRRPALGLAGAVAILVIVAIGALTANLGLLSTAPSAAGNVGQLDGTNVGSLVSASPAAVPSPAVDQPAVDSPSVDQPSGDQPSVEQPSVDRGTSHEAEEGDDHGGDGSGSGHGGSGSSDDDDDD